MNENAYLFIIVRFKKFEGVTIDRIPYFDSIIRRSTRHSPYPILGKLEKTVHPFNVSCEGHDGRHRRAEGR